MKSKNLDCSPDLLYGLLIFLLVAIVTWPCIMLDRPFAADHSVHLAKTINLARNLSKGQGLFAWSHLWFGGYPTNVNYPFLGYLITVGLRWLSIGILSWDASYALTIFLTYYVYAYGVYRLASQALPRSGAVLAACFSLLDGGGLPTGGYLWEIKIGVWPCKLAIALCLLCSALYIEAFRQKSVWSYLRSGIVMVAAAISHPISLMYFLIIGFFSCVYGLVRSSLFKKKPVVNIEYLFVTLLLVVLASLFWFAPFFWGVGVADKLGGDKWHNFEKLFQLVLKFELFENMPKVVSGCLIVGSVFSLVFNRGLNRLFALIGLLIIILLVREISSFLVAEAPVTFGQNVQLTRCLMIAKPFLAISAAAAIFSIFEYFKKLLSINWGFGLVSLALIVGLFISTIWNFPSMTRKAAWDTVWLSREGKSQSLALVRDWVCNQDVSESSFYRIGFLSERFVYRGSPPTHGMYNINHSCDIPLFKMGFTPAVSFKYLSDDIPFKDLGRLAVRYLMADKEQSSPDLRFFKKVGDQFVYEVRSYSGAFTVIEGSAKVRLKNWGDELVEYEITESKDAVIEVPITDVGFWRVSQNGQIIETRNSALKAGDSQNGHRRLFLVQVPVKDGNLKLEYQPPRIILILSHLGFLVWFGMITVYFLGRNPFAHLRKSRPPKENQS